MTGYILRIHLISLDQNCGCAVLRAPSNLGRLSKGQGLMTGLSMLLLTSSTIRVADSEETVRLAPGTVWALERSSLRERCSAFPDMEWLLLERLFSLQCHALLEERFFLGTSNLVGLPGDLGQGLARGEQRWRRPSACSF